MANKWVLLTDNDRKVIREAIYGNAGVRDEKTDKILDKIIKKLDDAEKRIKVSSAKGKGRGLQYWVAERISKLINIPFEQHNDEALIRSREMGQSGADIILRGEARKKFPFTVECKSCENINFRNFVEQAKKYSDDGKWLLVIRTKSLPDTTVTMSWGTFENLFGG